MFATRAASWLGALEANENEVSDSQPQLSVVVPCHNEEANLRQLVATLSEALAPLNLAYELIITDDRSTDGSWDLLKQMAANDPRLRAQRFEKNSGQSAALWAGIRAARGAWIATLDADLQNDPRDLPLLLE